MTEAVVFNPPPMNEGVVPGEPTRVRKLVSAALLNRIAKTLPPPRGRVLLPSTENFTKAVRLSPIAACIPWLSRVSIKPGVPTISQTKK